MPELSSCNNALPTVVDWMRLNLIHGLGPRLRQALLDRFKTPTKIFTASLAELQMVPGVGATLAHAIFHCNNVVAARDEIRKCEANHFKIITDRCDSYPSLLKQIADPPGILFLDGTIIPADALAIAIVGTRHASRYGLGQAARLAAGLAHAGFTIVSGLARGIDTAAHQAALDAGGRTLAVLGSGLLNLYPPENKKLAKSISKSGAVLSEHCLDHPPRVSSFPQRNRIVTGMSLGVIVIEAAARSGALISARHAIEQNREVFVLPGRVDSRTSSGCHHLIRQGAILVENVDQILEEFGPLSQKTNDVQGYTVYHPAELQLNRQERLILSAMDRGAVDDDVVSIENIVRCTGLPVNRVLSTISVLETKRLVKRISGNQLSRR